MKNIKQERRERDCGSVLVQLEEIKQKSTDGVEDKKYSVPSRLSRGSRVFAATGTARNGEKLCLLKTQNED